MSKMRTYVVTVRGEAEMVYEVQAESEQEAKDSYWMGECYDGPQILDEHVVRVELDPWGEDEMDEDDLEEEEETPSVVPLTDLPGGLPNILNTNWGSLP